MYTKITTMDSSVLLDRVKSNVLEFPTPREPPIQACSSEYLLEMMFTLVKFLESTILESIYLTHL